MDDVIGETVGSYRIVSKLSVGGMGTVYRAEHTLLGKLAAVKVLHPELSGSQDIVKRFFNEAKAATTIKHPGIVEVFDFGYMASGHAFLTMEFLEGMSLARRIKTGGKMSEGEAAMLLRGLCSALAAAHANGIVHRDLKPDNIFLVTDPDAPLGYRPKILDFGIAKLTDIGLAGTATKTGAVMGTPTYMSPEQCRGTGDVDHRADLYSLGCIFYELVTGRPPFTKLGAGELIGAHIYAVPESPSTYLPSIAKETEVLIMALLHKKPERRPQSARELAQRLQVLATNLGWITQASPDGVTAQSLRSLTPAGVADGSSHLTALDSGLLPTAAPTYDPSKTTPIGSGLSGLLSASEVAAAEPVEKPTTLSGAASQSMHDAPRRSRKPLGIAMLSAAILAGGAVAAVRLTGGEPAATGAAAVAPKPEPLPAPEAAKPAAPPVEAPPAPKPEPVEVATPAPPVEEAKPVEPPAPTPIAKRPTVKPRPAPKKPVVKPAPTPTSPKPDPKGCEQPPCLERDGL